MLRRHASPTRLPFSGLLASVSATALFALTSPALAICTTTGTVTFAIDCDGNYGPNATATASGSTLTVTDETVNDPSDGASSFSRIVLKAGTETSGAINIGVTVNGDTYVDSHNSAAVYLLTQKGNITVDIGADVVLNAQQSGIFAKADNGNSGAGGTVTVTNYGTITAGTLTTGPFGSEGIRVRALQGTGTIYNYGTVTSSLGRGLRIDGSDLVADPSVNLDDLIVNGGEVTAWLDAAHVNASRGDATIENTVDGVLKSRSQRGAVASSTYGAASLTNDGEITALAGAGALVWGAGNATLTNSGTITATNDITQSDGDFLFFGTQVWSKTAGDATLTNEAGGKIIAHDGWGAWVLSTDGDVKIDNAGTILGESTAIYVGGDQIAEQWLGTNPDLPDYAGAVGGDLTVTNSGLITADLTTDFTAGKALITLAGYDLGTVSVTNTANGFIGAGFAEDTDFSLSALTSLSRSELQDLDAAASNAALSVGAEAEDGTTIKNEGTLVGRVWVASANTVFGSGPSTANTAEINNIGLWVTSGTSSIWGTVNNSGTLFSVGETELYADIANSSDIWVRGTTAEGASLTINGDYSASADARLLFDLSADPGAMVDISGAVSGQTKVALANLDTWNWKTFTPQTLIDIASTGAAAEGADSFVLETPDLGLVHYNLAYNHTASRWTLSTSVSDQSVAATTEVAQSVLGNIGTVTSDLLNRTDDLRDGFAGSGDTVPMGYAETTTQPAEAAFAALTPAAAPIVRQWAKGQSAVGSGDGFEGRLNAMSMGLDVTASDKDKLIAVGTFGAFSGTRLDYDGSDSSANLDGRALGVYGTFVDRSGLFAGAVLAAEKTDIDLVLSGEEARFGAWTAAGRFDVGYRLAAGTALVEPSVALKVGAASYDEFSMSQTDVSIDNAYSTALEGRLRLTQSVAIDALVLSPFAILTVGASQNSSGTMELSDIGAEGIADASGAYGGVALGLSTTSTDGRVTAYARGDLTLTERDQWATLRLGGSLQF